MFTIGQVGHEPQKRANNQEKTLCRYISRWAMHETWLTRDRPAVILNNFPIENASV